MNASGPATGNLLSFSGTDAAFFLEVTVKGRQVRYAWLRRSRRLQRGRQVGDDHPFFYFSTLVVDVFDFDAFHGCKILHAETDRDHANNGNTNPAS